jgi:hypothetical protein
MTERHNTIVFIGRGPKGESSRATFPWTASELISWQLLPPSHHLLSPTRKHPSIAITSHTSNQPHQSIYQSKWARTASHPVRYAFAIFITTILAARDCHCASAGKTVACMLATGGIEQPHASHPSCCRASYTSYMFPQSAILTDLLAGDAKKGANLFKVCNIHSP